MIRCDRLVLTPFISTYNWPSIIENSSVGDSDNYGSTNRRQRFPEFSFQENHWVFFLLIKHNQSWTSSVRELLYMIISRSPCFSKKIFFNLDFTQIFSSRLKRTLAVHSRIRCCGGKAHMPQTNRAVVFGN